MLITITILMYVDDFLRGYHGQKVSIIKTNTPLGTDVLYLCSLECMYVVIVHQLKISTIAQCVKCGFCSRIYVNPTLCKYYIQLTHVFKMSGPNDGNTRRHAQTHSNT